MIRTVCKYSKLILITDDIFALVRFFSAGDAVALLPSGEDKIIPRNDSAAQDVEMHWEICHIYL